MSQAGSLEGGGSGPPPPDVPTQFDADVGSAIPIANVLNILGTGGIATSASGNTVTLDGSGISPALTISGNDANPQSPTLDNWDIVTANATPVFSGASSALTLDFNLSNLGLGSNLPAISSGTENVAIGGNDVGSASGPAGGSITDGFANTVIGYGCGASLTTGSWNVLLGQLAGWKIQDSSRNVAIGNESLSSLSNILGSSGDNVGVGFRSLANLKTGTHNKCIGTQSGYTYASSESSNICIGNLGIVGDNNTMRLGGDSGSNLINRTFVAGIYSVTNLGGSRLAVVNSAGQLSAVTNTTLLGQASINTSGGIRFAKNSGGPDCVFIEDDFIYYNTNAAINWPWKRDATGTGATSQIGTATAGHPGVYTLNTGTDANSECSLVKGLSDSSGLTGNVVLEAGATHQLYFVVNVNTLATISDDYKIFFGLGDSLEIFSSPPGANFVGFQYLRSSSTNWQGLTIASNVQTVASGGTNVPVATGWVTCQIQIALPFVRFYVGSTLIGTSTTNIPTGQLSWGFHLRKTAGTSPIGFDIDYTSWFNQLVASRF